MDPNIVRTAITINVCKANVFPIGTHPGSNWLAIVEGYPIGSYFPDVVDVDGGCSRLTKPDIISPSISVNICEPNACTGAKPRGNLSLINPDPTTISSAVWSTVSIIYDSTGDRINRQIIRFSVTINVSQMNL